MSNGTSSTADELSFSAQERIDRACDDFEAAWKSSGRPRIEELLAANQPRPGRLALLRELLNLELFWRKKRDERPEPREYIDRFPERDECAEVARAFMRAASAHRRFTPHELHATGGLGAVFKAHDEELNREVALKKIREQRAHDPQSQARFLREAEVTGQLEHPGIVPVYSLNRSDDGSPFYAMRFIHGETLQAAITRFHTGGGSGPGLNLKGGERLLAFRGLIRRFIDVCNPIAYAHSRNVLHRDIKPDNIMLGPFGETLVLDWGLTKALAGAAGGESGDPSPSPGAASGSSDTQPGSRIGTLGYMSPEQAAGQHDQLGPASDVYSLGATLYAILTGQRPLAGEQDANQILKKTQEGDMPPPSSVRPDIPRPLEAICRKAMALRPEDRYPSARSLADDLESWMAGEPVTAWSEPFGVRAQRWVRRHRTLVTTSAAVILVAFVGLGGFSVLLTAKNRELDRQIQRAEKREQLAIDAVKKFRDVVVNNRELKERKDLERLRKALLQEPINFFRTLREQLESEHDTRPQSLLKLATASFELANTTAEYGNLSDAMRLFRESLTMADALVRAHSDAEDYDSLRASCHNEIGNLLLDMGEPIKALGEYRDDMAICERLVNVRPHVARYKRDLAVAHDNIANAYTKARRGEESIGEHRHAVELRELLAHQHPETAAYQSDLAVSHQNIGAEFWLSGRYADALPPLNRAKELWEQLARDHPQDPSYRDNLSATYAMIANSLYSSGRAPDWLPHQLKAEELLNQVIADCPGVPSYRARLADLLRNLGMWYQNQGQVEAAQHYYKRAVSTFETLVHQCPEVRKYAQGLGRTYGSLALFCDRTGRRDEGLRLRLQELSIWEEQAKQPDDLMSQGFLAGAHSALALNRWLAKDMETAETHSKKSLKVLDALLRKSKADVVTANLAAGTHETLGQIYQATDRLELALSEFESVVALHERAPSQQQASTDWISAMARAQLQLGEVYGALGRRQDASRLRTKAIKLLQHLEARARGDGMAMYGVVVTALQLAQSFLFTGELVRAREFVERSLTLTRQLAQTRRNDTFSQLPLVVSENVAGLLEWHSGHTHAALGHFERARKQAESILRADQGNEIATGALAVAVANQADVLMGQGRLADALKTWNTVIALHDKDRAHYFESRRAVTSALLNGRRPNQTDLAELEQASDEGDRLDRRGGVMSYGLYALAQTHALCCRGFPDNPGQALATREAKAEPHAARALELLRRAHRVRLFEAPVHRKRLEKDPFFDPLRGRRDFQDLMTDISFPAEAFAH